MAGEILNVGILFSFPKKNEIKFVAGNLKRIKAIYPDFDINLPTKINTSIKNKIVTLDSATGNLFEKKIVYTANTEHSLSEYIKRFILLEDATSLQFSEPFSAVDVFNNPVQTIDEYSRILLPDYDFNLEDYKKCIMITPKGVDFKMKNGYKGKIIQDAYERNRLKAIANQTLTLTWVLAAGAAPVALLALADLYWKYKWFRAPDWWGMVILNIVVSALTSYVVWKWLQWKQMKKVIV